MIASARPMEGIDVLSRIEAARLIGCGSKQERRLGRRHASIRVAIGDSVVLTCLSVCSLSLDQL